MVSQQVSGSTASIRKVLSHGPYLAEGSLVGRRTGVITIIPKGLQRKKNSEAKNLLRVYDKV
jgi:hypothetical protein